LGQHEWAYFFDYYSKIIIVVRKPHQRNRLIRLSAMVYGGKTGPMSVLSFGLISWGDTSRFILNPAPPLAVMVVLFHAGMFQLS
jgi:hypothetical protein